MSDINKTITPNRGVELILSRRRSTKRKLIHIIYEKMICFLKREVTIYFEFSIKLRKIK
jgi:hypothetical protein